MRRASDLFFRPPIETGFGLRLDRFHALRRVILAQADIDRMDHHRAQRLAQAVRAVGLLGAHRHQGDDVFAQQGRCVLVAILVVLLVHSSQKRSMMLR
jgi:hypothetical protein